MAFPEVVPGEQWLEVWLRRLAEGQARMSDPLAIMKTCLAGHPTGPHASLARPRLPLANNFKIYLDFCQVEIHRICYHSHSDRTRSMPCIRRSRRA